MRIDKDVPIPTIKRYDFATMQIGDSHLCETVEEAERMTSAAYSYAKHNNKEFRVIRRKVEDGYRVWRVS